MRQAIDVYSFAIVMWEILARQDPWDELTAGTYIDFVSELELAVSSGKRPMLPTRVQRDVDASSRYRFVHRVKVNMNSRNVESQGCDCVIANTIYTKDK